PRLAAWCYRHRWRVLIFWIILLVGVNVLAQTVGGDLLKTFSLPGSESQRTFDILKKDFARPGDTGQLVFKVKNGGTVRSPEIAQQINAVANEMRAQKPHVLSVSSLSDPDAARRISPNGQIAYDEIQFNVQSNDVPVDLATKMRGIAAKANTS